MIFGVSPKAFAELALRVKDLESSTMGLHAERLQVEQHRSQLYMERNQHLQEVIDRMQAHKRSLMGEIERGNQALRDAVSLIEKAESPEKIQELEPVRRRVSEMNRPITPDEEK